MEVPWIFLSHSGEQKDFTRRLYHELKRVGHHPFFDQDEERSLLKGHPFPTRILEACRGCKMGVVVLSDKYMASMWPMLELEQLCFHNRSILIYPLFYRLKPADLSSKLTQWQRQWDEKASVWPTRCSTIDIDMSTWPAAVKKLKYQNGDVRPDGKEDDAWIETIVSNICKTLPPPQCYLLGHHIKGGDSMQSEIDQLFHKLPIEANGVIPLGVHGKGGSGKTTLCKIMANFYNKDFPGRSSLLEFPCVEDKQQLLDAMKNTLSILVRIKEEDLKRIYSIEEAMSRLGEVLKRHRVFLAIDNVWHWNLENARQIINMKYIEGSRVMVTSRSEKVLHCWLSERNVVHVPSISEEEALEAILSYSNKSSLSHVISKEDLRSLAESCFNSEEQCHPMFLTVIGAGLGQVADGHMKHEHADWKEFTSTYAEGCVPHALEDISLLLIGLASFFVARNLPRLEELRNELQEHFPTSSQIEDGLDELESEIEDGLDELKSTIVNEVETRFQNLLTSFFDV